ncbi:MAG: hypothetical protein LBL50_02535 [Candidatus Margulisbacteria bacterium]|jgi:hypothetical protein|nr:hypothetical protein [Candidatus Margulisiibacteriota bacterium]
MKRKIAVVPNIRFLSIAVNNASCAKQSLHPGAVPADAPASAKDKFFREMLFAYADANYLQKYFWREIMLAHNIKSEYAGKLSVDFLTNDLFIEEDNK